MHYYSMKMSRVDLLTNGVKDEVRQFDKVVGSLVGNESFTDHP